VIAVTGATGELGGRVARGLAERGVAQRLIVRDASRAPSLEGAELAIAASYRDGAGMRAALAGCDTVFLVSAREAADRMADHRAAVEAAVAAGVGRIVYTSFLAAAPDATFSFARDHFHTERLIRETGVQFDFLRSSLYAERLLPRVGSDDVIRGPGGDGRVAPVARDDVAAVALALLTGTAGDTEWDVTGPDAITLQQAAAVLAQATGRPIRYQRETLDEARASRAGSGAEPWEIEGWITSYAAIATGELDIVSDTVERKTGRRPISLAEVVSSRQ
jgi:uncharacterized protein YbjT (DUF2867 family)